MTSATATGLDRPRSAQPGRALWLALIAVAGICLSPVFACATPFAALATVAALKLNRRDMIAVTLLVWAANQAIGYGLLHYPLTWDSAAWGLAIGVSSVLAVVMASALSTSRPAPLAISLPFVAAFATFELGLYLAGFALPVEDMAFSAAVVRQVFVINAVSLCSVMAAYHALVLVGAGLRSITATPAAATFFR